jgi:hypothetical protein
LSQYIELALEAHIEAVRGKKPATTGMHPANEAATKGWWVNLDRLGSGGTRDPLVWGIAIYVAFTASISALAFLHVISIETFWHLSMAKYAAAAAAIVLLFIVLVINWFRSTPRGQRGPDYRFFLLLTTSLFAVGGGFVALGAACDWVESHYGVPSAISFIISGIIIYGMLHILEQRIYRRRLSP